MKYQDQFTAADALIGLKQALKIVGISKPQVYRLMRDGLFPRPIKIGKHRVAWIEAEVYAYLTEKVAQRNKQTLSGARRE